MLTGKKRQRFVHKVTASPLEPSMMKSLERAEKSNIQGLPAFCSAKDIPRRKRTKRGDGVINAINSGTFTTNSNVSLASRLLSDFVCNLVPVIAELSV